MGIWDALIQSLECPKCHAMNRIGAAIIDYEPHLKVACCGVCGNAFAVQPAVAPTTKKSSAA